MRLPVNPVGIMKFSEELEQMFERLATQKLPNKKAISSQQLTDDLIEDIEQAVATVKEARAELGKISHSYRLQSIFFLSKELKLIANRLEEFIIIIQATMNKKRKSQRAKISPLFSLKINDFNQREYYDSN